MQQLFLPERSSCVFSKWTILPNVCLKWSLTTSEAFSNDGLDEILSQSLDMFEEVKNSVEDAIDITDMFEFGYGSEICN